MSYSETILNYFYHLEHAGRLEGVNVYLCQEGSIEKNDLIQFFLKVNKERKIEDARFQCNGGVILLATCEYLCAYLKEKPLTVISYLKAETILNDLKLSSLFIPAPARLLSLLHKLQLRIGNEKI